MDSDISTSELITDNVLRLDSAFHLLEEIPSEGFNRLVIATRFGRKYLLKGLKAKYREQKIYQELLRKEFDILIAVDHPGIVRAEDLTSIDGLGPAIVMEYIEGMTLKKFLQTNPSPTVRRKIADALIDALAYIHKTQVVHRDLKPSNILITTNGNNPKLIDFGLSDTDSHTIFKQPAGTRSYMSAEQLQGGAPDCRNDIYSLGKILLELAPGRVYMHCARKCLRPIDKRYKHAEELAEAIARVRHRERILQNVILMLCTAIFVIIPTTAIVTEQRERNREQEHTEWLNSKIECGKQMIHMYQTPLREFYAQHPDSINKQFKKTIKLWEVYSEDLKRLVDSLTSDLEGVEKSMISDAIYLESGKQIDTALRRE